jgi:hypothetical protein
MTEVKWELITTVSGELQADLLRNLLKVQGIKVFLSQEGAGRAVGLTMGPMGEVQVLVPENQSEAARQIVDDYYAGKFESSEDQDSDQDPPSQG